MPVPSIASEVIARIAQAFEREGIRYVVIGGQAVLRYGRPRLTDDIDFSLLVPCYRPEQVLRICADLGLESRAPDAGDFILRAALFPAFHRAAAINVDFAFGDSPYEEGVIERAEVESIHGVAVRFASAEDLVIQKVLARRDVDLGDIRWIVVRRPQLDRPYIVTWLARFEEVYERPLVQEFECLCRQAKR